MSEKFRIEKRSNFTVVSNDILMNNFMSMKATCLLLKMLGKPDNWDYTISGMKTFCKEGRDAICRRAFQNCSRVVGMQF